MLSATMRVKFILPTNESVMQVQTALGHTEDFDTYQAHAGPVALTNFKLLR